MHLKRINAKTIDTIYFPEMENELNNKEIRISFHMRTPASHVLDHPLHKAIRVGCFASMVRLRGPPALLAMIRRRHCLRRKLDRVSLRSLRGGGAGEG